LKLRVGDLIQIIGNDVEFLKLNSIKTVMGVTDRGDKTTHILIKDDLNETMWWSEYEPYIKKLTKRDINRIIKETDF
jgi:hypothetical protein